MDDRRDTQRALRDEWFRLLLFFLLSAVVLSAGARADYSGAAARRAPKACSAAPAVPIGLAASGTVGLGTFLHWSTVAAPAGCSVAYTVFQNGAAIGTSTNTSFAVTGLAHSSTYAFTVTATDAAGSSNPSTVLDVATPAATGHDYFVAPSGNDTKGNGSQTSPWATIGHAVSLAQPGDTVYVGAGVYSESVTLSTSGTASAPIIIDGQGEAIVDGSQVACCTSPAFAASNGFIGDSTEGLFNIGSQTTENHVTVEGFTIQNYATTSDAKVPVGILIAGAGTGINILDNTVKNIHAASTSNANAYGMGVFGIRATPLSVTVSYNTVTGCLTGLSETTTFNGNVQNFVVSYNIIYGNNNIGMDAIGFEGVGPAGADQAKNGDVYGNVIYNNSGVNNPGYGGSSPNWGEDGLYCDGCAQVVFERNTVYANDIGIEAASEITGKLSSNVIIRNNLVYGSNSAGITVGGYAKSGTGGSSNITILNNSLYNDDLQNTGSGEFQIQYRATGITFENNVVYAGAGGIFLNGFVPGSGVTLDHNDYYTTSSTTQFVLNKASYSSFAKYRHATGQDQNSVFANPAYVALPTCSATGTVPTGGGSTAASSCTTPGNLEIQAGSPARNTGNATLGSPSGSGYSTYEKSQPFVGSLDFNGHARVNANGQINIGAFEDLTRALQEEAGNVSDAEIASYYKLHQSSFETATLARIFIPRAAAMTSLAADLRERAAAGEDPDKLQLEANTAAGISTPAASRSRTTLENVRRTSLPPNHESVMDLNPGGVSEVFSDPDGGQFIYKMLSRSTPSLDAVRTEIHTQIAQQRSQDAMKSFEGGIVLSDAYFAHP